MRDERRAKSSMGLFGGFVLNVALLTGCTPNAELPQPADQLDRASPSVQTMEHAREHQNRILESLVSLVPDQAVIDDHGGPVAEGTAISCTLRPTTGTKSERPGVMLPGRYAVDVNRDADLDMVLDEVYATYAQKPGWVLNYMNDASGEADSVRVLELISPHEYKFFAEYYPVAVDAHDADSGMLLRFAVSSFSPCFEAPEGYDPFESY